MLTNSAQVNVEMNCIKGGEGTTIGDSAPSGGKNPLKRVCRGCGSADKALQRRCGVNPSAKSAAKKAPVVKTEAQLKSEAEHKALSASIKVMPEPERQSWYRDEKAKREKEEAGSSSSSSSC